MRTRAVNLPHLLHLFVGCRGKSRSAINDQRIGTRGAVTNMQPENNNNSKPNSSGNGNKRQLSNRQQ